MLQKKKETIKKRLAICDTCEYKKQLSQTVISVVTLIHETASIYKCGKCNCPLAGKTANMKSECPLKKW